MRIFTAFASVFVLCFPIAAAADGSNPTSRCMSKDEAAKLPPEWRTFDQREGSSNGSNIVVKLAPPDGTKILVYFRNADVKFAMATVHCRGVGPDLELQINVDGNPQFGYTHWLPLVPPKNEVPM